MKKLLGIVVLSFLIKVFLYTDVAYANKIPEMTNSVWIIKTHRKETVTFNPGGTCSKRYRDIIMRTSKDCTWKQQGNLITMTGNDNFWTTKLTVSGMRAKAMFTNLDGYAKSGTGSAEYVENWLTASSNTSSANSSNNKIAQSKQICKDLGFKVNTEKFADCALKMMSMQFEATNKVASSGGTTQEIIVKHKNDYDIWDALLDTSTLLRNNNTSNSSSSSGTNCKVYQREWGADMVCR